MPVNPSDRMKGTRVGVYEIVGVIGHGATASVYEGVHTLLGKPVAIKILHEHVANEPQVRERFLREGRIAARLRHPNIIDVVDVGEEGATPYLVMDLLAGGDLRTLLADVGALAVTHALALLVPIVSALGHAHDVGVVHRDLKPANIFLARDTRDNVVPTLVDFGLSKAAGVDATSSSTQADLVAGTVLYMAPEQTLGVENSSASSDQYALAAILYEALTGRTAISPDSLYVMIDRIRNETIVSPCAIAPSIPSALGDVVLRALDRDPQARFPNMRAFGAALLPFADAETVRTLQRDFAARSISGPEKGARAVAHASKAEAVTRTETPEAAETSPLASYVSSWETRSKSPLPCPAGKSPFRIKGLAYRGFVHMVRRVVPGGLDAFCDALDDASLRPFLHQPFLASARFDVLPFVPLFATLARLTGGNFVDLVRSATAAQCRYDARTVYRAIFSTDSATDVPERISRFCAQYYDYGTYHATMTRPNRVVVVHGEIPEYAYAWQGPMHIAYTEECARIVGATGVMPLSHVVTPAGKKGNLPLVTMQTEFAWGA